MTKKQTNNWFDLIGLLSDSEKIELVISYHLYWLIGWLIDLLIFEKVHPEM